MKVVEEPTAVKSYYINPLIYGHRMRVIQRTIFVFLYPEHDQLHIVKFSTNLNETI